MALVALPRPLLWGYPPGMWQSASPGATSNYRLDAAGEKIAIIFRVPPDPANPSATTVVLSKVLIRVYLTPSAQPLRISLQDLDSNGDPDGVADQFRVISPVVGDTLVGPLTSDGTDGGTKRTATIGAYLALVAEFAGTTGDVSIVVATVNGGLGSLDLYRDAYSAGAWTKTAYSSISAVFALQDATGAYLPIHGALPLVGKGVSQGFSLQTFNTGSSPDERGNRFALPFGARCSGIWAWADYDSPGSLVLYDAADNVLGSAALPDTAVRASSGGSVFEARFPGVTLTAGLVYRVTLKPSGAGDVSTFQTLCGENAALAAYFGTAFYQSTRADAGAWTDLDYAAHLLGPVLDAIDIPAGGGRRPRMRYA